MIKRTLKLFSAALILGAVGGPGGPPASAAETNTRPADKIKELFGDAVIAKGKGWEIKRSELDAALISVKAMAAGRGQTIPPERINGFERQVLDDLIALQLLLGKATEADKAKGKEQFAKSFQKFKTDAKLTDAEFDEKLNPQLRVQGLTREQWEQKRTDQATVSLVLEREMKISISDEDVKRFYDENPAKFEQPEMVRASHILLSTRDQATGVELAPDKKEAKRKLAEELLKRARAGEDFAKLAKEYSEDPGSKDKGGEYKFPRGQMVPEFESAAFSLGTNQVSDIVTTQFGYHIIKLSEKFPAQKVELTKVTDELKEGLKQQGIQKQLPDFIAKLKGEANVEILDEKLKNAEVPAATRSGQSANEEVPAASRSSRSAKETGIVGKTKANVDKVLDGWSSRKSDRSSPSDPIYYYTKDVEIIVHFRNERAVGLAVIDRPGKGMSPITQTRFDELVALLGAKPEPTNITRDANGIREFSVGDPGDAH